MKDLIFEKIDKLIASGESVGRVSYLHITTFYIEKIKALWHNNAYGVQIMGKELTYPKDFKNENDPELIFNKLKDLFNNGTTSEIVVNYLKN